MLEHDQAPRVEEDEDVDEEEYEEAQVHQPDLSCRAVAVTLPNNTCLTFVVQEAEETLSHIKERMSPSELNRRPLSVATGFLFAFEQAGELQHVEPTLEFVPIAELISSLQLQVKDGMLELTLIERSRSFRLSLEKRPEELIKVKVQVTLQNSSGSQVKVLTIRETGFHKEMMLLSAVGSEETVLRLDEIHAVQIPNTRSLKVSPKNP